MQRRIVSRVVAAGLIAAAMAIGARAQAAPEPKGSSDQPMVFYIAKGAPGACGPGCSEWIAAEGRFDAAARPRLWDLLRKIGNDRKPPVFFHSRGGSVWGGLEIGQLIRSRGLATGVGRTLPTACDRQNPGAAACDALKQSGGELAAELDVSAGYCASICSYAVLGGVVRHIGVGAQVGVHHAFLAPTVKRFDESGHVVDRPQSVSADTERRNMAHLTDAFAKYLKAMGISVDFLNAANAINPDDIHILTRDELVAFGIDRRDAVEDGWTLVNEPLGASAVDLVETRDGGAFRWAKLSLTCRDATTVRLQYARQARAEDESPAGLRLIAGDRSVQLVRLANAAQGRGGDRWRAEGYAAELPLAALDAAAFAIETNATSGQSPESPAATSARVQMHGAAPALAALAQRCASGGH